MSAPTTDTIAGKLDFDHCNVCGYAFERRFAGVDVKKFLAHKAKHAGHNPFAQENRCSKITTAIELSQ